MSDHSLADTATIHKTVTLYFGLSQKGDNHETNPVFKFLPMGAVVLLVLTVALEPQGHNLPKQHLRP